jgi:hypothetical protein
VDHPYSKWQGAHWVIASLADIGYPTADEELKPICDQVMKCWLALDPERHGCDRVSWGGVKRNVMNGWVTADAVLVLVAAGRLSP